jgi:hypothetical protein
MDRVLQIKEFGQKGGNWEEEGVFLIRTMNLEVRLNNWDQEKAGIPPHHIRVNETQERLPLLEIAPDGSGWANRSDIEERTFRELEGVLRGLRDDEINRG